jgi:hypothetical protein
MDRRHEFRGGGGWVAAFDPRVTAVVSSAGVHDGERWLKLVRAPNDWFKFRDRVREEAKCGVTGEKTATATIYRASGDLEKPVATRRSTAPTTCSKSTWRASTPASDQGRLGGDLSHAPVHFSPIRHHGAAGRVIEPSRNAASRRS